MSALPVAIAAGAIVISGFSALALCGRVSDQERVLGELEERLHAPAPPPAEGEAELERLAGALADLEERLARLESSPRREVAAAVGMPAQRDLAALARPEDGSPGAAEPEEAGGAADAAERAELEELLKLFGSGYDWEASGPELERFYELAKKTGLIDEKLSELEAEVAAAPDDLDLRMELADTYVAKLMTVQGPEMGLWGSRAEEQWRETEKRDPEHWRATFSLGQNFAYYPDVMGKTDEAIAYLERARAIQERGAQGAEHVRTYLSLARLYQRKGDVARARDVLHAGLRHHPGNAELGSALESLGQ